MNLLQKVHKDLTNLLCDPQCNSCVLGTENDNQTVDAALAVLKQCADAMEGIELISQLPKDIDILLLQGLLILLDRFNVIIGQTPIKVEREQDWLDQVEFVITT